MSGQVQEANEGLRLNPNLNPRSLYLCKGQALTRVGVSLCQAKGKKRMKAFGSVNVPQEAFMAVLNLKQDD